MAACRIMMALAVSISTAFGVQAQELVRAPNANAEKSSSSDDANTAESVQRVIETPDRSIAQQIQQRLKSSDPRGDRQTAIASFYEARDFLPIWISDRKLTARAKDALAFLVKVDEDGLVPDDYRVAPFNSSDADKLAASELQLTTSVLTFITHASVGRLPLPRSDHAMSYDVKPPAAADSLNRISASDELSQLLGSYLPQHAAYKALRAKLAEARAQPAAGNAATVEVITANLERWRWIPHDLGRSYVVVNIPDFTLKVVSEERTIWATRVVVGKPGEMATPLLSEMMKSITVNPTWNVPQSIIHNEYLPALQRDPGALSRIGLKIEYKRDGSVRVFQLPGERNALGRIRFNFPNKFFVYHHDTPNKSLFAQKVRALSHGCMRVQDPDKYAEVLLSLQSGKGKYSAQAIRSFYGSSERTLLLSDPIPVHLTYQTAYVNDAGHLETHPDIYGRDRDLVRLLRGEKVLVRGPDTKAKAASLRIYRSHRVRTVQTAAAPAAAVEYAIPDRHASY